MQGGPSQNPEPAQEAESREVIPFSEDLRGLRRSLGDPLDPIPQNSTDEELGEMEMVLKKDLRFQTFHEQFRSNELIHTYNALQRQKELEAGQRVNMSEFIVVNQARTYHEYFPIALEHVVSLMEEYEQVRASIPSVPEGIRQKEGQARLYIQALERAVQERVNFANVLLIDNLLGRHFFAEGRETQNAMSMREEYAEKLNTPDSQESFDAASGRSTQELWNRGNALNQRIIDILAGKGGIEGVPDGFFPQQLLLDLLAHRYAEIVEEQQHLARDPNLVDIRQRFEELLRRNDLAREGEGELLSEEVGEEYRKLRSLIHSHFPGFEDKSIRRRELMHSLVAVTEQLGDYHLRVAELTAIQHHFGEHFDFEGAKPSTPDQTPENIREAIARNVSERQQFHLDRMDAFLGSFEANVLNVGAAEITEDFWNEEGGRAFIMSLNDRISNLITIPLPEKLGIREWARNRLKGPLKEAMGWPSDKLNVPFEELPQEDRKSIIERAKSILTAIQEYDRGPMEQLHESIATARLLNSKYPSSKYLGESVQELLPTLSEPITTENLDDMVSQYGAPTVYFLLFDQCDSQLGAVDPPSGFMGEQAALFEKINKNIDVHLDVGSSLYEHGRMWEGFMYYLLAAAAVAFASGALTMRYGPRMARGVGRGVLRQSGRVATRTREALRGLRQRIVGAGESLGEAAKKVAEARIARHARNTVEAVQATRGVSALAKVGVGVDSILLVYEGYQVFRLWKEVGILAESRDLSALIAEAEKLKKPLVWAHTGALAVDATATGILSTHILSGGTKLAFVSTTTGGIALVAIPIGMTMSIGMWESLASSALHEKAGLRDRVEGHDETAIGQSKYAQLWGLGDVSLTLKTGALFSHATVEELEEVNQDEREEIVLGLTLSHLKHTDPRTYELLLQQLVERGRASESAEGVPQKNTINAFRYDTFVSDILLPYVGQEFVRRVEEGGGNQLLKKGYREQLLALNIRKGTFGSYISAQDFHEITFDAAQMLQAWIKNNDDVPSIEEGRALIERSKAETLEQSIESMNQAFGSHAERVLKMSTEELAGLRKRHAQVFVDILYHDHSALEGIVQWRNRVDFAVDKDEGISLIADRLEALNVYLLSSRQLPWLMLRPVQDLNVMKKRVSPNEAFYEADGYRVTDQTASGYRPSAAKYSHASSGTLHNASLKNAEWRHGAVKRYRELLEEFSS
jgi:hypothetical protein